MILVVVLVCFLWLFFGDYIVGRAWNKSDAILVSNNGNYSVIIARAYGVMGVARRKAQLIAYMDNDGYEFIDVTVVGSWWCNNLVKLVFVFKSEVHNGGPDDTELSGTI